MPDVPYIGANQRVTASRMNQLWSEFDRRMTLAMDDKSWLLWQRDPAPQFIGEITGKRFFFTDVTTFGRSVDIAGTTNPNYDHSVYTASAAAGTYFLQQDADKIVLLSSLPDSLDGSLEAHKYTVTNPLGNPEDYWIWAYDTDVMPQRLHRYAVAELVFETSGVTSYTIPNTYNKYQYFRCHNLSGSTITVTFTAFSGLTDFTLTIPAWASRCCQRRPLGQMEAGYNYFWKFKPGDPRSLTTKPFGGNVPAETMRVNNVWNPALLFEVIELFSERSDLGLGTDDNPVRIIRDPHVVYELDDLYTSYFADPATGTNLVGDILHHKGEIHYNHRDTSAAMVRATGSFNGYATISGDLGALGLTVNTYADHIDILGTVGSEFNDLVTPGTNLLYAGGVVTAQEITAGVTIYHTQPAYTDLTNTVYSELYLAVDVESDTITYNYRDWTVDTNGNPAFDLNHGVAFSRSFVSSHPLTDETTDIIPHADTITDVLTFNTFGQVALNGTNQDSTAATLQNRRMALTLFGPMILWEQKYDFVAGYLAGGAFSSRPIVFPGRPYISRDASNKLVEKRWIIWGGNYGWPDLPARSKVPGTVTYNGSHGGVITPRRTRATNAFASGGKHPNYSQPISGPDGQDFQITPLDRDHSTIRTLFTPGYASPSAGNMPVWSGKDKLVEYDQVVATGTEADYVALRSSMQGTPVTSSVMPRVKMLREQYNTMAAYVNSCKKARPFCFTDFQFYLPATSEQGYIGVESVNPVYDNNPLGNSLPPIGTRGLFDTSVRPRGQYTAFDSGSFLDHLFTTLGVPVKTESDLPSDYLTGVAAACDVYTIDCDYDIVVDTVTNIGTNLWRYTMHNQATGFTVNTGTAGYKIGEHNANDVFDANRPTWPVSTPGADDLVLSYRWVLITDVQAAVEAYGLKFIFNEVSVPVSLTEFGVGYSNTTLVDYSPTYHEQESTTTPRSTGVYQSRTLAYPDPTGTLPVPPPYDASRLRFVHNTTGLWKRDPQCSFPGTDQSTAYAMADVQPADVYTFTIGFGITDDVIGATGSVWFVLQFDDASAAFLKHDRSVRTPEIFYNQCLMYQMALSTGYTADAGVWEIPIPFIHHTSSTFSLTSDDYARTRQTLSNAIYPFSVGGGYSSESYTPFSSGSNFMTPGSGNAFECLFWNGSFVDLT